MRSISSSTWRRRRSCVAPDSLFSERDGAGAPRRRARTRSLTPLVPLRCWCPGVLSSYGGRAVFARVCGGEWAGRLGRLVGEGNVLVVTIPIVAVVQMVFLFLCVLAGREQALRWRGERGVAGLGEAEGQRDGAVGVLRVIVIVIVVPWHGG
ncbi:hypothetical protein B0J12DRAFT_685055 [Macrophomina phaseolina]|uniref:Uncharacterized protein n=1 Tax=Macrophomina phaseolina TaxID=35725 RepID=A0ABQ8FWS1_9PEZI|nr:hypothetical protein B0J12DRAFT_685055 [Macrophomina phaseolina]